MFIKFADIGYAFFNVGHFYDDTFSEIFVNTNRHRECFKEPIIQI